MIPQPRLFTLRMWTMTRPIPSCSKAIAHADRVAQAVALDMTAVGWRPTLDNYLGRVTKGRILQAVSEAKGDTAAERIRALKKAEMAKAAEDLLIGTGWLPEPLRTPGQTFAPASSPSLPRMQKSKRNRRETAANRPWTSPQPTTRLVNRRLRPRQSRPNNTTSPTRARRCAGPFLESAMSESIADLARRLAQDAEAVCRHYLSNRRRQGRYWIVGDLTNNPGRSLYVRLYGPDHGKGAVGHWTDAAAGEHGDLLDLIRGARRLATMQETVDEARCFLSLRRCEPPQRQSPAPAGSPEAARRLFAMARPIRGTVAETYLRRRSVTFLQKVPVLRFHPRCLYRADDNARRETMPTLLAAVTDLDGTITGVHRTWLARDGADKARSLRRAAPWVSFSETASASAPRVTSSPLVKASKRCCRSAAPCRVCP